MNRTIVLALTVLALAGLGGALTATDRLGGSDGCCPMSGQSSCQTRDKTQTQAPSGLAAEGVVNDRCPIMGGKIDPAKVPAALTREFNGHKVGFCCGGCPAAWDKLSDTEKQAKLDKVKIGS